MNCPYCHNSSSKVLDKRDNTTKTIVRRRRLCIKCNKRFTTYERIETISFNVVKRNGSIEEFDRMKLKKAILSAVKKRRIPDNKIDDIVNDIENNLQSTNSTYIKSSIIGDMVLERLIKIDKIGYLLFASVYKDFNTLSEFESALQKLKVK